MNNTSRSHEYLLLETASVSHADPFNAALTGIRALAALMVIVHHLFAIAGPRILSLHIGDMQVTYHWLLTCGWMGANVFFVLSGFLLAIPFARHIAGKVETVRVTEYLLRRIKRVVPAYWLQIAILTSLLAYGAAAPTWQLIVTHLLFLQNVRQDYASALNGVYWTLPVEFGYYLLLPLFAAMAGLFARHKQWGWLALCISLVATSIAYRTLMFGGVANEPVATKFFVLLQLPGLIDHFAIGMLLAWIYVRYADLVSSRVSDALVMTGLLGIVAMMAIIDHAYADYWSGHYLLFVGYSITASFIGALVLGTATGSPLARMLFANRPMLFVGLISYSLYLWHLPIIRWTMAMLDRFEVTGDRWWWLVAIAIPASFLAATLSYYLVERPFMTRKAAPPAKPD